MRRAGVDPWIADLKCAADHGFFLVLREPAPGAAVTAGALEVPDLAGAPLDARIARWLTDDRLRPLLSTNLARVIARIADSWQGRRVAEPPGFDLCPLHGDRMRAAVRHGDVYLQGLRCPRGHDLADRSGNLWFQVDRSTVILSCELPDGIVRDLVTRWLGPEPEAAARLHASLRDVLKAFASEKGERPEN